MDRFVKRNKINKPGSSQQDENIQNATQTQHNEQRSSTAINLDDLSSKEAETSVDKNIEPEPTRKRKHKVQKYRENWSKEFKWLENKNKSAYCRYCLKSLKGGNSHFVRHSKTNFHKKNEQKIKGAVSVKVALTSKERYKLQHDLKFAQLKLCINLAEHNLSFSRMDHATKLYGQIFHDSQIATQLNMTRTKTTDLLVNIIAPYVMKEISAKLNKSFFSIIIDETTDISTKKCLVVAVRFFDDDCDKVRDYHFALLELAKADAETITNEILSLFKANGVNIKNLLGFASDNASVMIGQINGVKAKLERKVPNLFVMPCISHTLHLCASKACSKLPEKLEIFCHEIFNYFAQSVKRQREFQELQSFTNLEPHKLLRPCQTRWLSLQMAVNRICEQWPALTLYFQAEVMEEDALFANFVLNCLLDYRFQLYFKFLKMVLTLVVKLNTYFQSETPKFSTFLNSIKNTYKAILKCYIKPNILTNKEVSEVNPDNPDFFLPIGNINLGLEAENFIISKNMNAIVVHEVRVKCLNFLVTLCTEIHKRVNFKDETLVNLAILDLNNCFEDDKPNLSKLTARFPNIIGEEKLMDLGMEWEQINELKGNLKKEISDIDKLISFLKKQKNEIGEPFCPLLVQFLKSISCLPHSSASAERIFSQLSLIKTKYKNKIDVSTCNSLLLTKYLVKNSNCVDCLPPEKLIKLIR